MAGNKRQREVIEDKGEGKRIGEGRGGRVQLDREETDVAHRQMVVYKSK